MANISIINDAYLPSVGHIFTPSSNIPKDGKKSFEKDRERSARRRPIFVRQSKIDIETYHKLLMVILFVFYYIFLRVVLSIKQPSRL